MNHRPTLLCVGAGPEQLFSIETAQKMGYNVVALDENPSAPGFRAANQSYTIDLRNTEEVIGLARANNVVGTVPVPIGSLLTVQASVHDALGLKGISSLSAERCVNKLTFRSIVRDVPNTVDTNQIYYPSTQDAIVSMLHMEATDLRIVKPVNGSGSRGVFSFRNRQQLEEGLSLYDSSVYGDGLLVEDVVVGEPFGVDGAIVHGELQVTLLRSKKLTPPPFFVETTYLSPARTGDQVEATVYSVLADVARRIGLDNCVLHADLIVTPSGKICVVELSGRPSGLQLASRLVPLSTGVKFITEAIRLHVSGQGEFRPIYRRPTILHYWGKVSSALQEAQAKELLSSVPGVIDNKIAVNDQDAGVIDVRSNLPGGYIIIQKDSYEEAEKSLAVAIDRMKNAGFI